MKARRTKLKVLSAADAAALEAAYEAWRQTLQEEEILDVHHGVSASSDGTATTTLLTLVILYGGG